MPGVILALALTLAQAEETPVLRQEIVVTAEREEQPLEKTTAAVTILERKEIELAPAEDLAEIISAAPGVQVLFAHPGSGVPMTLSRGFFGGGEVEYVRLLVDGVPVYDVESGLADWRSIRTSEIERVEIVRGPGSALWGDTALGGVIQVFTRQSVEGRPPSAALALGSFGAWSADFSWIEKARKGSLSVTGTDGYRDHSSTDEAFGNFSLRGSRWFFSAAASHRDREEPGLLSLELAEDRPEASDPMFEEDREQTWRARASLSWEHSSWLRSTVHGSMRESDATRTLLIVAGIGDRLTRELSTNSIGTSLDGGRGRFHFGIDAGRDGLDTSYGLPGAAGTGSRWRAAGFITTATELSSRFRLTGGVRLDYLSDDFEGESQTHTAWSPRIGLNFEQGDVSAFGQLSRAFKAPTLDQLFDPRPIPDFAGGSFTISNPRLSPQTADNLELGLSYRTSDHRLELVSYRTAVDDEIDFDPATFRYANIGSTLHTGIEVDASFFRSAQLSPRLVYALTRVTPEDGENQLKNIPRHLVRAGARAALPFAVDADVLTSWIGERFLDDSNEIPLDDAVVVDLRLRRRFGKVAAHLDLLNLTDQRYHEVGLILPDFEGGVVPYVLPAAGFSIRAGVEWRF